MGRLIEEWKDIQGFEGLYQVSNLGNVRNAKGKLLKPCKKGNYGHAVVSLRKDGETIKFQVHRLVAINFIPNPRNKPEVCHKNNALDEKGFLNNAVYNLSWGTHKENCRNIHTRRKISKNHADVSGKKNPNYGGKYSSQIKRGTQVLQWQDNRVVAFYNSFKEASDKIGLSWQNIKNACDGKCKQSGGYEWSYVARPYNVDKVLELLESEIKSKDNKQLSEADKIWNKAIRKTIKIVSSEKEIKDKG